MNIEKSKIQNRKTLTELTYCYKCVKVDQVEANKKMDADTISHNARSFAEFIDLAPVGIFFINDKGHIYDSNKTAAEITGYSMKQLNRKSLIDISEESEKKMKILLKALIQNGKMRGEFLYRHKVGKNKWWRLNAANIDINRHIVFISDITDIKEAQETLLYMGYHDQLTGLYNRRYFESILGDLVVIENHPISIVVCDINGLKNVNDSFGYSVGDSLLVQTSGILKQELLVGEIVIRFGGGEFIIICPKTDSIDAKKRIESIKQKTETALNISNHLSLSFGYDSKKDLDQTIQKTIENAENQMLMHKLYKESSYRSKTLDVIMQTLFEKSDRESLHSKRVSAICQTIAVSLGLNSEEIDIVRVAGLIHDIGKIGISEGILNKPSSLNDHEWSEMKRHSEIGWRILNSSNDFKHLAEYVFSHHERWDGQGYPEGKAKENIPIESRIIALADAYDAMTNTRSYREKMTENEALEELIRCSGTQFDPEIVDTFVNKVMRIV